MQSYSVFNDNSQERIKVLESLSKQDLNDGDRNLLVHLLNIISRESLERCAYFGNFYDEPKDKLERCLAAEMQGSDITCPFYNKSTLGCCDYRHNKKGNI